MGLGYRQYRRQGKKQEENSWKFKQLALKFINFILSFFDENICQNCKVLLKYSKQINIIVKICSPSCELSQLNFLPRMQHIGKSGFLFLRILEENNQIPTKG